MELNKSYHTVTPLRRSWNLILSFPQNPAYFPRNRFSLSRARASLFSLRLSSPYIPLISSHPSSFRPSLSVSPFLSFPFLSSHPSLPSSFLRHRLQHALRDPRPLQPSRQPGLRRHLQQDLANLLFRTPINNRAPHMHRQFGHTIQCTQHRDDQHAPRPPLQARPRPHPAPARLGRELLHWTGEVRRVRSQGALDVLAARHGGAHLQPGPVEGCMGLGDLGICWLFW